MPGGERGRLVEEKKLGVVSAPHLATAVLEPAHADEPVLRLPAAAAQRPVVAMQPPAAIAHQPAALGDGVKFAERIDAILQRPRRLETSLAAVGRLRSRSLAGSTARRGSDAFGRRDVALELRPNCEYCDKDLPPDSPDGADLLLRVHLLRRLRRWAAPERLPQLRRRLRAAADQAGAGVAARVSLAKRPASTKRARAVLSAARAIARFVRDVAPDRARQALNKTSPSHRAGAACALACASPRRYRRHRRRRGTRPARRRSTSR